MGALLGLLGALGIGLSDLFGRRIVQASSALTAAVVLQLFGGALAAATMAVYPSEFTWPDAGRGAFAGVGMGVGLGCYYAGLARSASTVVAPLVATLAAVVPFVYVLATTGEGSLVGSIAAAVAIVGLALVSTGADAVSNVATGVRWGLASGIGYGTAIAVLTDVSADSGAWPAVTQRISAFALLGAIGLATRQPIVPPVGSRGNTVLAGGFVAMSSIALLIGVQLDASATVITLSMFPAFTVAIGRLFFDDPIAPRQAVGIAIVLVGLAGIVGG
ncbi:MAG: DMT family transporter [Actinomycetota bacterium]